MKTLPLCATAAALLLLSACNNQPEVIGGNAPDPNREKVDAAPKKALPPTIETSVSFRCQPGNTLLFVDFFKGGTMATLRTDKDSQTSVLLNAPAAGEPYVGADGSRISGNARAATIVTAGGTTHTCKG